jgi:Tfp pilus tip-associated adhesin PilY1
MDFGVALTANDAGNEPNGFELIAFPGSSAAQIDAALNAYTFNGGVNVTWGQSYEGLLDNWADLPYATPRSWSTGPFQYYCNSLLVITIGMSPGNYDGNVSSGFRQTPPADVGCNDTQSPPQQGCYLDDVAYFANTTYSPPPLTAAGNVKTYSVLVDSNVAPVDGANLLNNAAVQGGGQAFIAAQPGALASRLWQALTDAFSGEYSNAAVTIAPNGDLMLASYYEVEAGYPLYQGHLLAWQIDNNPNNATYGEIIPNTSGISSDPTTGASWDGGLLLASRTATAGEVNQGGFLQTQRRNGFTEDAAQQMYTSLMKFDSSEITAGGDLTTLLIDEVPVSLNQACNPLPHDFDYDCDSDVVDAQILVDFLRGVPSATFLSTGLPRGAEEWKMGDTGHSTAVVAPAEISAIALESHFRQYRSKLTALPGAVYVASNSGQIHAFDMEGLVSSWPTGGSELWFYMPRAKLDKNPDSGSKEFDGFQADDLMRSGQTYVNDGRLTLDHVWLDGYVNDLSGCTGPGYSGAEDDGVINPDGCEWHRVLTWSGGYGSRHVYALDVTNPMNPMFLWERTDQSTSYTGKGRSTGRPLVSSFWDGSGATPQRRWIAFWGSGSQPPAVTGGSWAQAGVYIHDMDANTTQAPTNYQTQGFALTHPGTGVSDSDADGFEEYPPEEEGMFGSPAGADLDGDGSIDVAYIGDSMGYLFKVAFDQVNPNNPRTCLFAAPAGGDAARHIYYEPAIFYGAAGELLVYWGTGSPFNIYSTNNGGIYAKLDPDPFNCTNANSTAPQGVAAPCATSSALFDSTGFYQLGQGGAVGEKIVGKPQVRSGRMFFATHIPGTDPCTLGVSRLYGMDVENCAGGLFDDTSDSYTVTSNLYTEVPGLISEPSFANGRLYALQVDGGGIDANSAINVAVTPSNYTDYVYVSHRHVF